MADKGSHFAWLRAALARVAGIAPGQEGDGLTSNSPFGMAAPADAERPWHERAGDLGNALEAWRKNPLARRLVGLTSAYVVGDGMTLAAVSDQPALAEFLNRFAADPAK
jgi:hypothetical protein